jgi:uncharacterized protein
MRYFLSILLACCFFPTLAQTYTIETVPNTKLVNNSYVSNPDGILNEQTVGEIDGMLGALEQQSTAQVAVVVIQSIGDADIFDFAQELFNTWGIGQAKEDNGLLILLVMDKRTVRLHTGYGLEGDLPDIICKHIEMQKMVPYFKQQDYNMGVLEGVREVVKILTDTQYSEGLKTELSSSSDDSDYTSTGNTGPIFPDLDFLFPGAIFWSIIMLIVGLVKWHYGKFTDSPKYSAGQTPNIKTSSKHFAFWFWFVPVAVMIGSMYINNIWAFVAAFYGYLGLGSAETRLRLNSAFKAGMEKKDYYGLYNLYNEKKSFWTMVAIFIPIPFAFMVPAYRKRMKFLREHPRDCGQCGKQATLHNDITEDPFLSDKQKFEENLKTVDYDVWQCHDCKAHQLFRYPTNQSKYEDCPKCTTVAYYASSTRTIRAATETSEGLKEETKTCKYCKFVNVRTYTTPKISKSSSGGGSGSSGGSWGGGSSGGGGASSSW